MNAYEIFTSKIDNCKNQITKIKYDEKCWIEDNSKFRYPYARCKILFVMSFFLLIFIITNQNRCSKSIFRIVVNGWHTKDNSNCNSFEAILAHEIGHAIGIDHPDLGNTLINKNNKDNLNDYIYINSSNVCENIKVIKNVDCFRLEKRSCLLNNNVCSYDYIYNACQSIYINDLMYSQNYNYANYQEFHNNNSLTSNDLASLYFLYPSLSRDENGNEWGLSKIPMKYYSFSKLKSFAEDYYGSKCITCQLKDELLECIMETIVVKTIENLKNMHKYVCNNNKKNLCLKLTNLVNVTLNSLSFIRQLRIKKVSYNDSLNNVTILIPALKKYQEIVENNIYDNPNEYTSNLAIDSIIDLIIYGSNNDVNDDNVNDYDSDLDGLPDEIEIGLDVLNEILNEIQEGHYKGNWDTDGDGLENFLDSIDDRLLKD
jgi:hypothetical protein